MQNKGKKRKDSLKENAKKMRKNAKFQSSLCKVFVHVCVSSITSHILLLSLYSFINVSMRCLIEMSDFLLQIIQ